MIFSEKPSLCRLRRRIVRMRRPIGVLFLDYLTRARIDCPRGHLLHCDAIFDRADVDAEVAGDAFLVDHLKPPLASGPMEIAWCEVSSQAANSARI